VASSRSGIALALLITAACGGGDDLTAPLSGSLEVSITTVGVPSVAPAYGLSLDGGEARTVGDSATLTQPGLAPGTHTVELLGVAPGCAVGGANPQAAVVTAGHTARVVFRVTCTPPAATGSLEVTVTTGGADLDADGYTVVADPTLASAAGLNDTVVFPSLDAGTHVVRLSGIADNCTLPTNPDTVEVPAGDTARAAFQVTCWPPLAGRIGFSRSATDFFSPSALFTIGADGRDLRQLTPPPPPPDESSSGDEWPAWSPDGTQLAFARYDRIFVADRDGGNAVQLTPDTLFPEQALPRWSPDGRTLLFLLGHPGDDEGSPLYSINANGTGLRRVPITIPNAGGLVWFSWAPNGRRLAAVVSRGLFCCSPTVQLWLINPDGTGGREVTDEGSSIFSGAVEWSPDGSRLLLIGTEISIKDTLDTPRREIFTPDAFLGSAAWSPDGTRLVFSMGGFGESIGDRLYIINSDGTGLIQITNPPHEEFSDPANDKGPVWVP
jgi:Tol biopolymer transport system component